MIEANEERTLDLIKELIEITEEDIDSFEARLAKEIIRTALKLLRKGHDRGQLKLISNAVKEMCYAYGVFNQYPGVRRISIFGSARTPSDHPDYIKAKALAKGMADAGWMAITGAADGIMKAGHEGTEAEGSFGLSIKLASEKTTNSIIEGDPKLINFRYFFTRKLMFMSHSEALAVFPGGVGTQDELFESLTLMQTGKGNIIPLVLLEGEGGVYWQYWQLYVKKNLLKQGWISPEDLSFFYFAPTVQEAVEHIQRFYRIFHSYRYVGDTLVIRLQRSLSQDQIDYLNEAFFDLVAEGEMKQRGAFKEEGNYLEMPRLCFVHTRRDYGRVRQLIDKINCF